MSSQPRERGGAAIVAIQQVDAVQSYWIILNPLYKAPLCKGCDTVTCWQMTRAFKHVECGWGCILKDPQPMGFGMFWSIFPSSWGSLGGLPILFCHPLLFAILCSQSHPGTLLCDRRYTKRKACISSKKFRLLLPGSWTAPGMFGRCPQHHFCLHSAIYQSWKTYHITLNDADCFS